MKKIMDLFNKQVVSVIALIGVLVLVIMYSFVYLKYTQMTDELAVSNNELEKELVELKKYYDNMEQYEQDTKVMVDEMEDMMSEYPADAREEDVLMLAVNIQKVNSLNYENINLAEPELVYSIPQDVVAAATIEGYEEQIDFNGKLATYVNNTDYGNLKGIIEQIYADPNRIAINRISYAKTDEDSNILEGIIDLTFYSAAGTDKEYVAPDIAEYISGTENIFQSISDGN